MSVAFKQVKIYVAGACEHPGGPGGWGAVLRYGANLKEISGGFQTTTAERMAIRSAISALQALTAPCLALIFSNNEYLVKAVNQGFLGRWSHNGWLLNPLERPQNVDLWQRLLLSAQTHETIFNGDWNQPGVERAVELAKAASCQPNLPVDTGYRPDSPDAMDDLTDRAPLCRRCLRRLTVRPCGVIPEALDFTDLYEYYFRCDHCDLAYVVTQRYFYTFPWEVASL